MKCTEFQDCLSAYFDNELTKDRRATVDEHVVECSECQSKLSQFASLSALTKSLHQPQTPDSIWASIEQGLRNSNGDGESLADSPSLGNQPTRKQPQSFQDHPATKFSRRQMLQVAAALAATLLLGFIGMELWMHGDHDHAEMVKAMEQVASEINMDSSTNLLLEKYGGSEVTYQQAITQVGYRPVATKGLPEGYSVESVQVLNMPCCKCTQTACRRPDNSRFFIYEHDNEETGWSEHRNMRQCQCGGNDCNVVELDDQLAATWEKDNRHITLLGVRDESEIELLAKHFDESS